MYSCIGTFFCYLCDNLHIIKRSMRFTDEQYQAILDKYNISAASPEEVVKDYEHNNTEWYHVTIDEEDFVDLACMESLKWYAFCRCHSLSSDKTIKNVHIHALVRFIGSPTLKQYRRGMVKSFGKSLMSPRTVFRKIICLDHVMGVLHYIACDSSRKSFRDNGMHSHYNRNGVYYKFWLHNRVGSECKRVRNDISLTASDSVRDISRYESKTELHDSKNCTCFRSKEAKRLKTQTDFICSKCKQSSTLEEV